MIGVVRKSDFDPSVAGSTLNTHATSKIRNCMITDQSDKLITSKELNWPDLGYT